MSYDHTQLILLAQPTAPARNPLLDTLPMMVLMVVIFYFLLIRPQQKKAKEHTKMVDALKSGASVVTRGGVVGTVQSVKDTTVTVRSLESKFEVEKHAIERVTSDKSDLTTDNK
jgi:preprotein translocase subunit YajC